MERIKTDESKENNIDIFKKKNVWFSKFISIVHESTWNQKNTENELNIPAIMSPDSGDMDTRLFKER